MSRRCERPDCAVVATVGYGFDASQRVAWFVDLASTPSANAGALCRRHAAAMVLPRGWWLDDRRPESASRLFAAGDVADGNALRWPDSTPVDAVAPPPRTRARRARSTPVEQPALGLDDSSPPIDQPSAPGPATPDPTVLDDVVANAAITTASRSDDSESAIAAGIDDSESEIDAEVAVDVEAGLDASAANEEPPTPWVPSFDHADDLDGLLDARSPLLARAFRGRRRPGS
jgi:hypothetical protein